METKLTEPFTATGGYHRKPAYRDVTLRADSPWQPDTIDQLGDATWCQLWRNHMLVEALRRNAPTDFPGGGQLLVLHHQLDPACSHAMAGYRRLLTDDGQDDVVEWTIDAFVEGIAHNARSSEQLAWADTLRQRYSSLDGSKHLI